MSQIIYKSRMKGLDFKKWAQRQGRKNEDMKPTNFDGNLFDYILIWGDFLI